MARKLTDARIAALQVADAFEEIPDAAHRMELADAIEAARAELNVTPVECLYLRMACRSVPDIFWRNGREPIFGWSRCAMARAMTLSERSISRIEQSLVRKGLIVHRDGAMLRRRGGCDSYDGTGVSLAPLAARWQEIVELARRVRREHREWGEARNEIYTGKGHIKAAAERPDIPAEIQAEINHVLDGIPERMCAGTTIDQMRRLRARVAKLVLALAHLLGVTETAHEADVGGDTKTNPDSLSKRPTVAPADVSEIVRQADQIGVAPSVALQAVTRRGVDRATYALGRLKRRLSEPESEIRSPTAYFSWLVSNDHLYFRHRAAYHPAAN